MTGTFNEAQSRALALAPKISGTFGVLFSLLIIITVIRDKNRRNKAYHRLLLGISIVDMSSGFWLGLSTWPIPAESTVLWSVGNDRTCTLQGFFTNFGITSSFYNASLTLYFLLVVRYGWKEHEIRKIEPYLHAIPLLWGFGTSFAGLGLGTFGNAILWCWIERTYSIYRWTFVYGPLWTMIVLVSFMSIMMLQYVWKLEKTTMKYQIDLEKQFSQNKLTVESTSSHDKNLHSHDESIDTMYQSTHGIDGTVNNNNSAVIKTSVTPLPAPILSHDRAATQKEFCADNINVNLNTDPVLASSLKPNESPIVSSQQQQQHQQQKLPRPPNSFLRRISSHRLFYHNDNDVDDAMVVRFKRTKQVACQCFWYTGAFYFNWVALSVSKERKKNVFLLLVETW
jgi:hypothetical protein